jgi:hypothetical protein
LNIQTGRNAWIAGAVLSLTPTPEGVGFRSLPVTTTERDEAVPIPEGRWVTGAPPRTSYLSPWFVSTIKHDSIESGVGSLDPELVDRLLSDVRSYLGA